MEKYLPILQATPLFADVDASDLLAMLDCLQASVVHYDKGATIFHQGEQIHQIAIVLEGKVHIQSDDYWGNHTILNVIGVGDMIGEAYVAPDSTPIVSDVVCAVESTLIFFEARKILTVCSNACRFHSLVVQHLFFIISAKNRALVKKLGHLSQRTIRAKLISYLSDESKRHGANDFTIPFNRQELADFLSVDRSALSVELSKMRDDGLLDYSRNHFILHH
ncbi:MAG: Crp/Fnr family transcriptional regulator [Peptococcaceae bacterium]|nr:Crp/Fnr family transcriptional regulator [Peptococcaceae bacterium]